MTVHSSTSVGYTSTIPALQQQLKKIATEFAEATKALTPEFGAYMSYSYYQEMGTHNKDGSVRLKARPHIMPSVQWGAQQIISYLVQAALDVTAAKDTGQKVNATQVFEKAWLTVLNGPIRQHAVELARALQVFEFGFHIRSIHGYAKTPPPSKIQSSQSGASSTRLAKKLKIKTKVTKKKTIGKAKSALKKLQKTRKSSASRVAKSASKAASRGKARAAAAKKSAAKRASARKKFASKQRAKMKSRVAKMRSKAKARTRKKKK